MPKRDPSVAALIEAAKGAAALQRWSCKRMAWYSAQLEGREVEPIVCPCANRDCRKFRAALAAIDAPDDRAAVVAELAWVAAVDLGR